MQLDLLSEQGEKCADCEWSLSEQLHDRNVVVDRALGNDGFVVEPSAMETAGTRSMTLPLALARVDDERDAVVVITMTAPGAISCSQASTSGSSISSESSTCRCTRAICPPPNPVSAERSVS